MTDKDWKELLKAVFLIFIFVFSIAAFWNEVHASEPDEKVELYIGAWSYHLFAGEHDYNETNKLFAVGYKGYKIGGFDNSFGDDSFFIAKNFKTWHYGKMRYDFDLYLVSGYKDCVGIDFDEAKVCPLPALSAEYTTNSISIVGHLWGSAIVLTPKLEF